MASKKKSDNLSNKVEQQIKKSSSHSRHNIGVQARGKKVKTYYDLIAHHGRVSEEEELKRLKKGIYQIQNIVQKRIKRLKAFEEKTGISSVALEKLRERGIEDSISTVGDIQTLREQYQAGIQFLRQNSSTIKGIQTQKTNLEKDLANAGYTGGELTAEQYERYKALANKFYSGEAKLGYYLRASGRMDQETLKETANREIVALLNAGDLDTVMDLAQSRIDNMYETVTEEEFDEW